MRTCTVSPPLLVVPKGNKSLLRCRGTKLCAQAEIWNCICVKCVILIVLFLNELEPRNRSLVTKVDHTIHYGLE